MGGNRTLSELFNEWNLAVEVYMRSPAIQLAYEAEYQRPRLEETLKANPQPPQDATAFVKSAFSARATGQSIQHGIHPQWVREAKQHLAMVRKIRDEHAAATANPDETLALDAELTNVPPEDHYVVEGD